MFKNISLINNPSEKKLFIEKIIILIKLVENFIEKENLIILDDAYVTNQTLTRIKELNIINKTCQKELILIKNILKPELYLKFITIINFNIKNKKIMADLLDKLDQTKRIRLSEKNNKSKKYRVIDLFCGAGGLSYGFKLEKFIIDLANDNDATCIETYKYNHPEVPEDRVILGDIKEIFKIINKQRNREVDVVMGGPPCQGFSYVNQQRIIDDPRNSLYKSFTHIVKNTNPKIVVMENVKGMYPFAEQIKEDFLKISYVADCEVLVSDEFGVAQKRPRLFFIAARKDFLEEKNIIISNIFKEIRCSYKKVKKHILKDALSYIKPLKSPRIKNMTEVDDEKTGKKIDINSFQGNENTYLKLINQNRKIDFVYNHKARYASDVNFEIFSTLKQGEDGTNKKIEHIFPYKHRNHIFKDKYFKLDENKPSKTITAHLRMDCLSHIHPTQSRTITPREAARIQSFPDDYFFLGPYLKTYMQIGNAVPPIMAKHIAKVIKKYLT